MTRIIPATREHVFTVARGMRQADIDEVRAATGLSPLVALLASFNESTWVQALVDEDDQAFGLFGVGPYMDDVGSPWMLATDGLYKHSAFFLRHTRPVVAEMLATFPILINYVDVRHTHSIRWLRWAGFAFSRLLPEYGVERRPFLRFSKVSNV